MISLCGQRQLREGSSQVVFVTHIAASNNYKLVLGPSHLRDLCRLRASLGDVTDSLEGASLRRGGASEITPEDVYTVTKEPPSKKPKLQLIDEDDKTPVRVICSIRFLEHVRRHVHPSRAFHRRLLNQLNKRKHSRMGFWTSWRQSSACPSLSENYSLRSTSSLTSGTESLSSPRRFSKVGSASRPQPSDEDTYHSRTTVTASMKSLTYSLATSQIQFQQLWIIIGMISRWCDRLHHVFMAFDS